MVLGNSMLIPELPKLAHTLKVSQLKIGLLISFFSLSGGLSIPILGYLSDKYSRKNILILSLLIYGVGGFLAGILTLIKTTKIYNYILAARAIQGFGAGGTYPLAIALVGDLFEKEKRSQVLGTLEAANAFGKVFSPLLGSIIVLIFWPGLFFIYTGLTLPLALLIYFLIPQQEQLIKKVSFKKYISELITIIINKGYSLLIYLITAVTVLFIQFGVLSFLSDLFETEYQITGLTKALLISIPIITMVIAAYLAGLYLKQNSNFFKKTLVSALIMNSLSLITLPFLDGLALYLLLIALLGISNGVILTVLNTIITSSTTKSHRGGITALYGSARFLGIALGPPIFTLFNQISTFTMFIIPAGIAFSLSLFILFFSTKKLYN